MLLLLMPSLRLSAAFCIGLPHALLVHRCTRFAKSSEIWSKPIVRIYEVSLWLSISLMFISSEVGGFIAIAQSDNVLLPSSPNYYALWLTITFLWGAVSLFDSRSCCLEG